MMNVKKCVLASGLLVAVLGPCIAAAALGEPESSVETDVARLHASIKINTRAGYRVHEMELPSGTRVREFVGMDGQVFAVAWNGPVIPNLRQTFGRYFDSYLAGAKSKHASHSQLQITQGDLVVQSGGHMRAFAGRAYLPQSIPNGVDLGEVR
jgi:hypothetical protein